MPTEITMNELLMTNPTTSVAGVPARLAGDQGFVNSVAALFSGSLPQSVELPGLAR